MKTLKRFWEQIPPGDRKLVKLTTLICALLFVSSMGALYLYARSHPAAALAGLGSASSDLSLLDRVSLDDSILPPPPPPLGLEPQSAFDALDLQAHREMARLRAERHEYQASLGHLERIANSFAEDLEFQTEAGRAYLHAGRPQDALAPLQRALALGADSPELWADLALAYFRGVHADSGIALIRAALQKYAEDPTLRTHLAAMISEAYPRQPESQQIFESVIKGYPLHAEARYQFGRHLMNRGNFRMALEQLLRAQEREPLDARIRARVGMARFHLGLDAMAEVDYRTALSLNPRDYNTWFNLGELYLSQANEATRAGESKIRTRRALESYLHTLEIRADHGPAHSRAGMVLNANGQHREAIRHLELALQSDPHSLRALVQIATAWSALGERDRALDYLSQAREIDPFNRVVNSQLEHIRRTPQG